VADKCPVCREPVPRGRDMTWPAVIGTFFGFWRGYAWMPGGFAHRHCLAVAARRLRGCDG
jgi:hypothetical protein